MAAIATSRKPASASACSKRLLSAREKGPGEKQVLEEPAPVYFAIRASGSACKGLRSGAYQTRAASFLPGLSALWISLKATSSLGININPLRQIAASKVSSSRSSC